MSRLDSYLRIALIVFGVVVGSQIFFTSAFDDTFITFRHSWNLLHGDGLVYNPGERFLGTSAPGFAVLLALLSAPWPEQMPLVANGLSCIAFIVAALAVFELGRLHDARLVGFMTGLLLMVSPLGTLSVGGEMPIQLALILWAFVLVRMEKVLLATILVALSCVIRPDAAIAAVCLFVYIWISGKRFPMRETLAFLIIVIPVYCTIWFYYGSPIPGSILAKAEQPDIGMWQGFRKEAGFVMREHMAPMSGARWAGPRASADMSVVKVALLLGVVSLLIRRRFWLILLSWPLTLLAFYVITDPPVYHWYLLPLVWPILLLFMLGVETLIDTINLAFKKLLGKQKPHWSDKAVVAGVLLLLTPAIGHLTVVTVERGRPRPIPYIDMAHWFNATFAKGTSIAHFEIGYIGFYSPSMKIIDPLGLVHPNIAKQVREGSSYMVLDVYDPEVVVYAGIFINENLEEMPGFKDEYVLVKSFPGTSLNLAGEYNFYDVYAKRGLAKELGLAEAPSVRTPRQQQEILDVAARGRRNRGLTQ